MRDFVRIRRGKAHLKNIATGLNGKVELCMVGWERSHEGFVFLRSFPNHPEKSSFAMSRRTRSWFYFLSRFKLRKQAAQVWGNGVHFSRPLCQVGLEERMMEPGLEPRMS